MDTTKLKIEGLTVLTAEDVYNMLVGAFEGGSNYWYMLKRNAVNAIKGNTQDMQGEPLVDRLLTSIQRGAVIEVHDCENDDLLGTLTAESWAKGEKLMSEQQREHLGDILAGNDDATTADVFLQFAL